MLPKQWEAKFCLLLDPFTQINKILVSPDGPLEISRQPHGPCVGQHWGRVRNLSLVKYNFEDKSTAAESGDSLK